MANIEGKYAVNHMPGTILSGALIFCILALVGCDGFSSSGTSVNTETVSGTYQTQSLLTARRLDNGAVTTQPGRFTFIISRRGRLDGSSDGSGVIYGPVLPGGEFTVTVSITQFSAYPDCDQGEVSITGLADGDALRAIVSSRNVRCNGVDLEIGGTITGERTASASTAITLNSTPGGTGAVAVLSETTVASLLGQ